MSQDMIDSDVWSAVVASLRIKLPLLLIAVRCSLFAVGSQHSRLSCSRCYQVLPNICNIHTSTSSGVFKLTNFDSSHV